MLSEIFALSCGGLFGVFLRYGFCVAINFTVGSHFPYGILCVNMLGGLVVGIVFALFSSGIISETVRVFFIPGLLGAFTTFSAYSLDTVTLFLAGRWLAAGLNVLLNNVLSLMFVWIGMTVVRMLIAVGWL